MKKLMKWIKDKGHALALGVVALGSAGAFAEDAAATVDTTLSTALTSAWAEGFNAAITANTANIKNVLLAAMGIFIAMLVLGLAYKVTKRITGR